MKKLYALLPIALLLFAFTGPKQKETKKGGTPLSAMLTGSAEIPGPGDPDGSGYFEVRLNQGQGTISFELSAEGIAQASGAHIHRGTVNQSGPVVVALIPPTDGTSEGEIDLDPELIKDIRMNPENYYVNVHNSEFPAGAIRGQLSK